jgi:hypothetical protein
MIFLLMVHPNIKHLTKQANTHRAYYDVTEGLAMLIRMWPKFSRIPMRLVLGMMLVK